MKNYEEVTHDLLERRDRYITEQKKKRKRRMGVATALGCLCLAALLGIGMWRSGTTPPITLENNSTISDHHGEDDYTMPGHQGGEQSNPPTNSQEDHPSDPAVTDPSVPSQTIPDPPSVPGGDPNAVMQSKAVSYQEAKALFAHPLVECFDGNFINYDILMASQKGDWDGFYFGVRYVFSDGQITLIDQDRMGDSYVFSVSDLRDKLEYNGHTFFVTKENYLSDSQSEIWYAPKMENDFGVGIVYSAHFDQSVDQSKIMDLILSLEIK